MTTYYEITLHQNSCVNLAQLGVSNTASYAYLLLEDIRLKNADDSEGKSITYQLDNTDDQQQSS